MIPYTTLNGKEVVYAWENPDSPDKIRMWCTSRLEKWCEETNRHVFHSEVSPTQAAWYIENRGIERHRVQWLLENPLECLNPTLMLRLKRGADKEDWDLMLDGHHRYVALAAMNMPFFKVWHLNEEEAKQFEVTGHPQPKGLLNLKAFSGLGLNR